MSDHPPKSRYFIAGMRPVKIQGIREYALDWKTGEFVVTAGYYEKIFRDHSPDIDEVTQSDFEASVHAIRRRSNHETSEGG